MDSRNISLDILKIILALFIVLLHCKFFSDYNEMVYFLSVHGVFRIAVPTFFLINGFFFNTVIENKKIKKWSIRVFILYAVWMCIYTPYWLSSTISTSIVNFLIGYHHLWYIKAMLLCGVLLFLIKKMSKKNMLALAIVLFSVGVCIQYAVNYHMFNFEFLENLEDITFVYRNFLFTGLPFFIIGYLIKIKGWAKKITSNQIIYLACLGMLFLFAESYINYYNTREGMDNLYSLILIAPFIFIYALNTSVKFAVNSKNIALLSTAIYLVHPLVMKILSHNITLNSINLSLLTIICSFIISLVLIKVNTKLKYLL